MTRPSTSQGLNFFLSGPCVHIGKFSQKKSQTTFYDRTGVHIWNETRNTDSSFESKSVSVATRKSPKSWSKIDLFRKCIKRTCRNQKIQFLSANNTPGKEIKTSPMSLDWSRSKEKVRVGWWNDNVKLSGRVERSTVVWCRVTKIGHFETEKDEKRPKPKDSYSMLTLSRLIVHKKIQFVKRKAGKRQIRIQEESHCQYSSETSATFNEGK